MSKITEEERRALAFHLAGHCAILVALGGAVAAPVEITGPEDREKPVPVAPAWAAKGSRHERLMLAELAGRAAEQIGCGSAPTSDHLAAIRTFVSDREFAWWESHYQLFCQSRSGAVATLTRALWPAVEALANRLLEAGSLTAPEANAIVVEAAGDIIGGYVREAHTSGLGARVTVYVNRV